MSEDTTVDKAEQRRIKQRLYMQKVRAAMTDEEKAEQAAKRKLKESSLTPEQLEIRRKRAREYHYRTYVPMTEEEQKARPYKRRSTEELQAIKEHRKVYHKNRHAARMSKRRVWMNSIKSTLSCELCGESHISTLDFHHKDPTSKSFTIADGAYNSKSIEAVLVEMAKCQVLCANCHRKFHYYENSAQPPPEITL